MRLFTPSSRGFFPQTQTEARQPFLSFPPGHFLLIISLLLLFDKRKSERLTACWPSLFLSFASVDRTRARPKTPPPGESQISISKFFIMVLNYWTKRVYSFLSVRFMLCDFSPPSIDFFLAFLLSFVIAPGLSLSGPWAFSIIFSFTTKRTIPSYTATLLVHLWYQVSVTRYNVGFMDWMKNYKFIMATC